MTDRLSTSQGSTAAGAALLSIRNLTTHFRTRDGTVVRAAQDVSFDVGYDEVVAVVGESGSGKSVTALSAMRLLAEPPARTVAGSVLLEGEELLTKSPAEMSGVRGRRIGMVFQNPYAALNPLISIGSQLAETLHRHRQLAGAVARDIIVDMLRVLDIDDPKRLLESRPYQASGGMNQRVMLALALLGEPRLLIADEPTTMLDAITQLEFFRLIGKVRDEKRMALWLITHDFGVVALMADRVVVMYAGSPVEWADRATILLHPRHPYTAGLIASVPSLASKNTRLQQIPGEPPDLRRRSRGCAFAPRCAHAMAVCQDDPPAFATPEGTRVRCWLYADAGKRP